MRISDWSSDVCSSDLGRIEYHALLFLPTQRPFDLFHPERRHHVKLYVKRVFITDDVEGLVPSWLRFVKGVVDCEDLPLNVSRELLQKNPLVASVSQAVTKRILGELKKKAENDPRSEENTSELQSLMRISYAV